MNKERHSVDAVQRRHDPAMAGDREIGQAPRCEIVKVVNKKYLIDYESYQRRYLTADAKVLAPGHYIVLWPSPITKRDYDYHARFAGPYRSASHARLLLARCLEECVDTRHLLGSFVTLLHPG